MRLTRHLRPQSHRGITHSRARLFPPRPSIRACSPNFSTAQQGSTADDWRAPLETGHKSVVALGKFDALHTGHRALAVQASSLGASAWMVSFSSMAEVLADDLQVAGVVVGEGFRFGYKAAGTTDTLRSVGRDLGLEVNVVDLITLSAASQGDPVSSSKVREALAAGQMDRVRSYLDRSHTLIAHLGQEDLARHRGNAMGPEYLRRIPRTCFVNQAPGKGYYQARIGLTPGHDTILGAEEFSRLQPATVAVTEFGVDIILPAKIAAEPDSQTVAAIVEFGSL
ncbi:hypothetical protein WJX73_008498 [Symbiochloris irregularis]|uniref:FAD synthase n=1 Tax=Symbiochloris irregularis TaxID=706552 RepID=A0AAW1PCW4_9CHLO